MAKQKKVEYAELGPEQLKRVEKLEKKLGAVVLAYRRPLRPVKLKKKQLAELEKAEEAMPGVCLVAYEAEPEG